MDCIYGNQRKGNKVSTSEKGQYQNLVELYFSEDRDYKEDLTRYVVTLQNRPPLSAKKTFSYVKEFLAAHDVELRSWISNDPQQTAKGNTYHRKRSGYGNYPIYYSAYGYQRQSAGIRSRIVRHGDCRSINDNS